MSEQFDETGEPIIDPNYKVPLPPKRDKVVNRKKEFIKSEVYKKKTISFATIIEIVVMIVLIFAIILLLTRN